MSIRQLAERALQQSIGTSGPLADWIRRVSSAVDSGGSSCAPATQTDWYVNAATGSDSNDGATPTTALQTLRELCCRLHGRVIDVNTTVHISGGDYRYDPAFLDVTVAPDTVLTIEGATALEASGTFTDVTSYNPATGVFGTVTGPGLSTLLDRLVRDTTSGSAAWIVYEDSGDAGITFPSPFDMQTGDDYVVVMPLTTLGSFGVHNGGIGDVVVRFLDFDPLATVAYEFLGHVILEFCRSSPNTFTLSAGGNTVFTCCLLDSVRVTGGAYTFTQCGFKNTTLIQSGRVMFEQSYHTSDGATAVALQGGCVDSFDQGFDTSAEFISVGPGATYRMQGFIFESTTADPQAVNISSGGLFAYPAGIPPAVSGLVSDFNIGGTAQGVGDLPYIEATNLAAAVEFV